MGPNAFTFDFLKNSWDMIEDDVFYYVKDFHNKASTASFLTLISKVNSPQSLSSTCPFFL